MTDTSGNYTLTGVTGTPITREAGANTTVTYTLTGAADTFNITGDAGSAVTITQTADVADVLNLVANDGTITLGETQTPDTIAATVENGGKLVTGGNFSGTSTSGSLSFGTGGGSIVLGTSGTYSAGTLSQLVSGFTNSSDILDDQHLKFTGVTGYTIAAGTTSGTQTVTIDDSSGNFIFTAKGTNLATGSYTSLTNGPLKLTADSTGGTNVTACFLAGVRISTPKGDVAVESLIVGDLVSVMEDSKIVSHPVKWIGNRKIKLSNGAKLEAYPVRVRAGAITDGVPYRDLLVTSDHCIHVGGHLIPVRMLVNDASITIDTGITSFTYYHVELDRHAILIADGLEAESYLDTGNRICFEDNMQVLRPELFANQTHARWYTEAAAPLAVDRATVEPIWEEFRRRAVVLGFAFPDAPVLVKDPGIHLVSDAGHRIMPTLTDGRFFAFVVPSDVKSIRLASRAASPSETTGPFLDDRRALGVLVGRIGVHQGRSYTSLSLHLTDERLSGWHSVENDTCRWTDGDALLPVSDLSTLGEPTYIDIEVLAAGPYLVKIADVEVARAA